MAINLTVSGENIHITNSKEQKVVEFALYGKAEQNTTTGKNLLNARLNVDIKSNDQYKIYDVKPNTTYVLSLSQMVVVLTTNTSAQHQYTCYDESGNVLKKSEIARMTFTSVDEVITKESTFTTPENISYIVIDLGTYYGSNSSTLRTLYAQLEEGNVATEIEPYTGGMPSPSPQYPQPIEVSGESGSVAVKSCGKNLLKNTATSTTVDNVEFVVNNDKSISTNGITDKLSNIAIGKFKFKKNKKYILSGCPKGGTEYKYRLDVRLNERTLYGENLFDYGNGVEIVTNEDIELLITLRYTNRTDLTNLTFYPMIRLATDTDDTYEPYKETLATIPTENGLAGIKVYSNGNYTDSNGQQWICDEIVKYADGSGEYIQRIGKAVFDGSDDEIIEYREQSTGGENSYIYRINYDNVAPYTIVKNALCSHFIYKILWSGVAGHFYNLVNAFSIIVNHSTLEEFKTWLSTNPITIVYVLATPIITQLTAEEIAEIEKLQTFYPVTNISNDFDCGMSITYVSTLIEFIEPKTDWTEKSRFNIEDYNRIKNNLEWLYQKAVYLNRPFEIEDMGEDIVDYLSYWKVSSFNAFEDNIEKINNNILTKDYGTPQRFYENGAFIRWTELNRIESAILSMKNILDNHEKGLRKIPFVLGRFKEIRL